MPSEKRHRISDDNHDLASALRNSGMDEEELWFIVRFAAEHGYKESIRRLSARGTLAHARRWMIRLSGWENTDISLFRGEPAWRFDRDPTPVSLFGHRVTFFGAGYEGTRSARHWGDMQVAGGVLVWRWMSWVYWSPDGTPGHPDAINLIGNHATADRERRRSGACDAE